MTAPKPVSMKNNGLRDGINRKDLVVGTVVQVEWADPYPPTLVIITQIDEDSMDPTYKGDLSFRGLVLDAAPLIDQRFHSAQILRVALSPNDLVFAIKCASDKPILYKGQMR